MKTKRTRGEQVTGKDHSQRTAYIEQSSYLLQGVFHVEAKDTAQETHDDKNIPKDEA